MEDRQQNPESSGGRDETRKTNSDQKLRLILNPIRLVIGIITIFAAIVGVWQWAESHNSIPNIIVKLSDTQCLTRQIKVAGLKSIFEYNNQEVSGLWVIKITLVNTCSRNIIGVAGGDLMFNDIKLRVTQCSRIVSVEPEVNEFQAQMSYTTNVLSIAFEKWRPGEQCTYRIYCAGSSASDMDKRPDMVVDGDPLRQGKIQLVNDEKESEDSIARRNLLKYLPKWIYVPALWSGTIVYGLVMAVFVILFVFVIPWIGLVRRIAWRMRHGKEFEIAIKGLESFDAAKGYAGIPIEFWQDNNIPPPILHLRVIDDVPRSGIVVLLVLFVFSSIAFGALLALSLMYAI